jgi:hypothetical protein
MPKVSLQLKKATYKISQDLMALWWRYQDSKTRLFAVYLDGRSGWLAEAGGQDVTVKNAPWMSRNSPVAVTPTHEPRYLLFIRPEILIPVLFIRTS